MLRQNIIHFTVLSFLVSPCFSAIKSERDSLMEELSGQVKSRSEIITQKPKSLSERHLYAGLEAFKIRNYILALKHYNTVVLKYRKSKEVKAAFLAKAKLYTEIGLTEQAELNSKMALQQGVKVAK